MFLSDISVKRPIFMTMILFAMLLFGVMAFKGLGIDMFPKIDFPVVTVVTHLPGAGPETVETKVTDVLEEAIRGVDSIKELRSISAEGISIIIVQFDLSKKINIAYQDVQEKVASVLGHLPQDVLRTDVGKFNFDSMPLLSLIVSADMPRGELTRLVDKEIKERLKHIPNIGQIRLVGGQKRNIWLSVDREKLNAYQLSLDEIEMAMRTHHLDMPGGTLTEGRTHYMLKTRGELPSIQAFEEVVVGHRGDTPILFRAVGSVEDGLKEQRTFAHFNGKAAMALIVCGGSGANTVDLATSVKAEVEKLTPGLEKRGVFLQVAQDNSVFIERAVEDVHFDLIFGGGLAILIVFLFLRNFRSSLVCAVALPVAVIGTFAFMAVLGFTQNMMTLLALSIAIGLLIDDAIVVQENIMRHIEEGLDPKLAARKATGQIALAVFATTMTIVAVFVPVAFMKGIVGQFFYEFGLTVSIAVLLSMFISFTLNPLFSSRFLSQPKRGRLYQATEKLFVGLEKGYSSVLGFSLRHKGVVLSLAVGIFVVTLFSARFMRFEFAPQEDMSQFKISVETPQGSSIQFTRHKLEEIEGYLKQHPWVEFTFSTAGSNSHESSNSGSIYVKMPPKSERPISQAGAMDLVRSELGGIEGCTISVEQFQAMEGDGTRDREIQFEIRGHSLEMLATLADEMMEKMRSAKGYFDIDTTFKSGKPQLDLDINRIAAAHFGITPLSVAKSVRAAFGGIDVSTFNEGSDRLDVTLRYAEPYRTHLDQLAFIPIRARSGELIPLGQVVTQTKSKGPTQINRYNRERQITVQANLDKKEKVLGDAMQEISAFMSEIKLPEGYHMGFSGQAQSFQESFGYLVLALVLAIVFVYMVLAAQFESFIHPLIIMLSLPLSLIGVIGSLVLLKLTMSIFTMIGIIMLMGLVTKNAILLIEFIKQLTKEGLDRRQAILKAGRYRLRPILMTTLSTIFGMLPVALSQGDGAETRGPMAVAVIGGLLTSTLLTLVIIPAIYDLVEGMRGKRLFSLGAVGRILGKKMKKASKVPTTPTGE